MAGDGTGAQRAPALLGLALVTTKALQAIRRDCSSDRLGVSAFRIFCSKGQALRWPADCSKNGTTPHPPAARVRPQLLSRTTCRIDASTDAPPPS